MFETKTELDLPFRFASTGGERQTIKVRWPSDEEWAARAKAQKFIRRDLGRGRSEMVPAEPGQWDLDLISKISLNGAPEYTAAEAKKVLELMATADVGGVRIEGTAAIVELRTLYGPVTHTLRIPTADQIIVFNRSAGKVMQLPYSMQEIRMSPDAGARLYDECAGQSADYDGPVPNIHKDAVIRELIQEIDREFGPRKADDPNF